MNALNWQPPGYEGDRRLAMCGEISVGAVFPPLGGKYWRWRVWIGDTIHAADGSEKSEELAKAAVAVRFARFLEMSGLVPKETTVGAT